MRGVRGAITVKNNHKKDIIKATSNLLAEMIAANQIEHSEIVSIIFTATVDLDQEYPAVAARKLGYCDIPLMCYQELNVEKSLDKCIRSMIYLNRDCSLNEISHIYLRGARTLRPDLVQNS